MVAFTNNVNAFCYSALEENRLLVTVNVKDVMNWLKHYITVVKNRNVGANWALKCQWSELSSCCL